MSVIRCNATICWNSRRTDCISIQQCISILENSLQWWQCLQYDANTKKVLKFQKTWLHWNSRSSTFLNPPTDRFYWVDLHSAASKIFIASNWTMLHQQILLGWIEISSIEEQSDALSLFLLTIKIAIHPKYHLASFIDNLFSKNITALSIIRS